MITITLIVMCFSFIGIKINKALYTHKYKNNIKKLDMYFDLCKKMAFSNQADVYLKLYQEKEKLVCEIGTDEKMGFFINSKKIKDHFENMYFLYNQKKINKLEILFSTTGEILPKGNLEFLDKRKKFKQIKII